MEKWRRRAQYAWLLDSKILQKPTYIYITSDRDSIMNIKWKIHRGFLKFHHVYYFNFAHNEKSVCKKIKQQKNRKNSRRYCKYFLYTWALWFDDFVVIIIILKVLDVHFTVYCNACLWKIICYNEWMK